MILIDDIFSNIVVGIASTSHSISITPKTIKSVPDFLEVNVPSS